MQRVGEPNALPALACMVVPLYVKHNTDVHILCGPTALHRFGAPRLCRKKALQGYGLALLLVRKLSHNNGADNPNLICVCCIAFLLGLRAGVSAAEFSRRR